MHGDSYELYGGSPTTVKLLRVFLASAIIDNGGTLSISRKSLSELSDYILKHKSFHLVATPDSEHGMQLTLECPE